MFRSSFRFVCMFVGCMGPIFASAQTDEGRWSESNAAVSFARAGKHHIELSAGLLSKFSSSNKVAFGSITTQNKATGVMGSISYAYWLEENLAVVVSSGLLSANVNASVTGAATTVETATVIPILFGVKYQPFRITSNGKLRPIISAAIGPYIGAASNTRAGLTTATESYTETAMGGRVSAGLDLAITNWLTLGAGAGYHVVSDFEKRIGSEKNYSGPEFSLAVGFLF